MFCKQLVVAVILGCSAWLPGEAFSQIAAPPVSPPDSRWGMLPTDRTVGHGVDIPVEGRFSPGFPAPRPQNQWYAEQPAQPPQDPPLDLKSLLTPRVKLQAEWLPTVDGLGISAYDLSVVVPTYPIFGPPPPMITAGYSFTDIQAPVELDLPSSLHDISLGMAWIRRINETWSARLLLSVAFASDMENTGSDAWQVRAGGFALYRPNEQWSWAFGALATGRDDLPVIPAVGAIWEPSPDLKVNLMLPNPRISRRLAIVGNREHWGYFGGGFSGGTWAYERASGLGDRVSYRDWRLVLGWESKPPQPPGTFRPIGTSFSAEVGYVFGREFEFDRDVPDISAGNTLLLRTGINF